MKKKVLIMFAVLLITLLAAIPALAGRPVHSVHVGTPDAQGICFDPGPGCEANYSLTAIEYADGSVSGQYTDQSGHGTGGFHAVIDCLVVEGNQAWVSGIITHETYTDDGEYVGWPVSARVVANGTSAGDPPDQITFSNIGEPYFRDCSLKADEANWHELYDVPQGQVQVN
jgi:hypothetical protein